MKWLTDLLNRIFKSEPVPPAVPYVAPKPGALGPKITSDNAFWMPIAIGEKGVKELPGKKHNKKIIAYHSTTSLKAKEDEVPWCSSFVEWVMEQAGLKGTNSAGASSWLNWGEALKEPRYGCVVISKRPGGNHVNFFVRLEKRGLTPGFIGLGGNQDNEVNEKWKPLNTVRGYRWPKV